jgi:hypothetical protein
MSDAEIVVVHTFGSQPEADLAKSALEAAGIDALIKEDSAGGMRPSLAWAAGYEVCVRAEDADAARDVLDVAAKPSA